MENPVPSIDNPTDHQESNNSKVIGKYVQEELELNNITHHVEYFEE